jgi:hypothetical protein
MILLDFTHMCITALANLAWRRTNESKAKESAYFDVDADIIPYFQVNWENLTSMPRRVKTTWHHTLHKTLAKEVELFAVDTNCETRFCLTQVLSIMTVSYQRMPARCFSYWPRSVPTTRSSKQSVAKVPHSARRRIRPKWRSWMTMAVRRLEGRRNAKQPKRIRRLAINGRKGWHRKTFPVSKHDVQHRRLHIDKAVWIPESG